MSRKSKKLTDNPARWRMIHKKYGLSREDYYSILQQQNGVCFICERPPEAIRRYQHLAVDHDHKTGTIRGLLCYNCNHRILPSIKEDKRIAYRLWRYLVRNASYGKIPS